MFRSTHSRVSLQIRHEKTDTSNLEAPLKRTSCIFSFTLYSIYTPRWGMHTLRLPRGKQSSVIVKSARSNTSSYCTVHLASTILTMSGSAVIRATTTIGHEFEPGAFGHVTSRRVGNNEFELRARFGTIFRLTSRGIVQPCIIDSRSRDVWHRQ